MRIQYASTRWNLRMNPRAPARSWLPHIPPIFAFTCSHQVLIRKYVFSVVRAMRRCVCPRNDLISNVGRQKLLPPQYQCHYAEIRSIPRPLLERILHTLCPKEDRTKILPLQYHLLVKKKS